MRRLIGALKTACFFLLCYAAAPLMASQLLLGECRIGLLALTALLPIAFILSLLPGKIGGGQREEVQIVRTSRGNDPDPDRGLRNEALPLPEKKSFPLRAFCCMLACAGVFIGMYMLPIEAVLSAQLIKRVFMAAVMAALLPMALRVTVFQDMDSASIIAGMVMYFIAGVVAHVIKNPLFEQWVTICALAFLIFSAFGLNDGSMENGAVVREGVRPPASMRRRNRMMIGVLGIVGGIVLYFDKIREWVSAASWWTMRMVGKFIAWLFNLGASDEVATEVSGGNGGQMNLGAIFGTSEKSEFLEAMEKVMFVVVIVVLLLLIGLLGRRIWRIVRDLVRRMIARLKQYASAVSEEYQDEQESLFDWGETTKELGEGLKERIERLLRREKRWEQMTVRERMRHILRTLYRRTPAAHTLQSLTAQEAVKVIKTGDAQGRELADLYDQARYAEQEPDAQSVERLRKEAKV